VLNDQRARRRTPLILPKRIISTKKVMNPIGRQQYVGVTQLGGPGAMTWYESARDFHAQPVGKCCELATFDTTTKVAVRGVELPPTAASVANCLDRILAKRGIQ